MANGIRVLRDITRGPLSHKEVARMAELNAQAKRSPLTNDEHLDLRNLSSRWQNSQPKPATAGSAPQVQVSSAPLSPVEAARLAELSEGANAGRLTVPEQREHQGLQRRWQAAHAKWGHEAYTAPATRRPGVVLPKRKDPFGG